MNTILEQNVLNVTLLEPRMKHPTVFEWFDALQPGKKFHILNDHDPKPLYYQMLAERGNTFQWKYLQNGPQWWEVEITKNDKYETVGEIAAKDLRKAEVFKKYGIDFCCGGKKSLALACEEANVDPAVVEAALEAANQASPASHTNDYQRWQADYLVDYIYNQHHLYYYDEGPIIADLATKVTERHGDHFPSLIQLKEKYRQLAAELDGHFRKEEAVLFPFIKELVNAKRTRDHSGLKAMSVAAPLQMMEAEHEEAGSILKQIRSITNDYALPEGACNSFALLYQKLEALENDLHLHIHLENNVLFPKAIQLERDIKKQIL